MSDVSTVSTRTWLFAEAVSLFEQGNDTEAAVLFRQLIARNDASSEEAKQYLERISERADLLRFEKAQHLVAIGRARDGMKLMRQLAESSSAYRERAQAAIDALSQTAPGRPTGVFRDAFAFEGEEAGGGVRRPLRRTPHMDVSDDALEPSTTIDVRVYVDTAAARDGEIVDELSIETANDEAVVDVTLLPTEHFTVIGATSRTLLISRAQERSEAATFQVRTLDDAAKLQQGVPGLTAVFHWRGRPAGSVARTSRERVAPARSGRVTIDGGEPADLTVTVVAKPINDGRQFWCTVHTSLLPEYASGVTGEWNLPEVSRDIVADYLNGFTGESQPPELVARLKGAGRRLFMASPAVFQKVFWSLVDAGKLPKTVAIVSDEPFIPWELMIPVRRLGAATETRPPLGVEFTIGRWTAPGAIAGGRSLSLADAYVIAPRYAGTRDLPLAQKEAELLVEKRRAERIDPATFANIEKHFKAGGRHLIHIACHGTDDATDQTIYLDNDATLASTTFEGMDAADAAFAQAPPLVFLNACEVGRTKPGLIGVGGFASAFIRKGAAAVIAPLWSVKDEIANEVARGFYEQIESKPFAEILQEFRARAYDPERAEDSYAAYCFYGDPCAAKTAAPAGTV